MHGAAGTDTGSARHKAAGTGAEMISVDDSTARDDDSQDDSNVINGLVLFVPGPPPPPGLKS